MGCPPRELSQLPPHSEPRAEGGPGLPSCQDSHVPALTGRGPGIREWAPMGKLRHGLVQARNETAESQAPLAHVDLAPSTLAGFPKKADGCHLFITVQTAPRKWAKPRSEGGHSFWPSGTPACRGWRAPHWADCAGRDPVQAAPAPGGLPSPGRFRDGTLFSSDSSPAREGEGLLQNTLLNTTLMSLRPWSFPTIYWEATSQPQ